MAGTPHCLLAVRAVPNAPRSEIVGWLGDALKIKLKAPPVEGRANAVLCVFLAEQLNLPRHAVTVLAGETSRQKRLRLEGLSAAELRQRLAGL